jgi:hypothetical protein
LGWLLTSIIFVSNFCCADDAQFRDQLEYVADSTVIVGLHGAGLTLSIFAPVHHSCLVEIVPAGFKLHLFQNVRSFGVEYEQLKLEEQVDGNESFSNLTLTTSDLAAIESTLSRRLRNARNTLEKSK